VTDLRVGDVVFGIDDADLGLIEGGTLHVRRGSRNREHHRYLYVRWGGAGKPEFSVARLILGLGHNDRTVQADHIDRDTTNNHRANLRVVTASRQAENRGGMFDGTVPGYCLNGHPRAGNMYRYPGRTSTVCRVCNREAVRRHRQRRKGAPIHTDP
jgi:hypothetical protein